MISSSGDRPAVKTCHLCGGTRIYYLFSAAEHRVVRCDDCGLVFLNPQPSDAELSRNSSGKISPATAKDFLKEISRYRGSAVGRLLEVGCGEGDFLELAEAAGWDVLGI